MTETLFLSLDSSAIAKNIRGRPDTAKNGLIRNTFTLA